MAELAFAKQFLHTLDSKPTKILPDHVEDPRKYPARSAYILPKSLGPPLKPRRKPAAPGSVPSISITLKSPRNPPITHTLDAQPLTTSILNLKESLSAEYHIPVAKLRILHNKKPVQDSKILKDLVGDETMQVDELELGVMVMGGAASIMKPENGRVEEVNTEQKVQGIGKGGEILKTEEFWSDLRGFLVQRLKDDDEGDRVLGVFRGALDGN